jgi:hypothetical protein
MPECASCGNALLTASVGYVWSDREICAECDRHISEAGLLANRLAGLPHAAQSTTLCLQRIAVALRRRFGRWPTIHDVAHAFINHSAGLVTTRRDAAMVCSARAYALFCEGKDPKPNQRRAAVHSLKDMQERGIRFCELLAGAVACEVSAACEGLRLSVAEEVANPRMPCDHPPQGWCGCMYATVFEDE